MALMHVYDGRANFTTKPRLQGEFSAFVLFVRGYYFQIYGLGNSFVQSLATLQFQNEAW